MLIIGILWYSGVHSVSSMCLFRTSSFRKRIGEVGIELIFQESIRVNNKNDANYHHDTAFINSTVQEKNIIYPTDAKLRKKILKKVLPDFTLFLDFSHKSALHVSVAVFLSLIWVTLRDYLSSCYVCA